MKHRRIYQSRKPTTPELEEALTIKDLRQKFSREEAEAIRDYVCLKSEEQFRCDKKFMANEEAERLVQSSKKCSEFVERLSKRMKKDNKEMSDFALFLAFNFGQTIRTRFDPTVLGIKSAKVLGKVSLSGASPVKFCRQKSATFPAPSQQQV